MEATTMSSVLAAMEAAYASVRGRHEDVPAAIIVVGPDKGSARGKLGHWARESWVTGDDRAHELLVTAEHLDRGARDVFETLLHEAAHAINTARGVKDHAGQRHNGRFKAAAEELGLSVEKQGNRGWAHTQLRPETEELYAAEIAALGEALTGYRRPQTVARDPDKAAKAKLSSAKSMTRWLAATEPAVLIELLGELGLTCPHCGEPMCEEEES